MWSIGTKLADISLPESDVGETLGVPQPAFDQGFNGGWVLIPEVVSHFLHLWKKPSIALQVGNPEHLQSGLAGAQ